MVISNSVALWGLFFILIPIVIHFFDFRRTKKIDFSNVSFLERVSSQNTPKSRLKEILLLLIRCLSIIFLVLVFAGPILKGDSVFTFENEIIVLDNSFSLSDNCEGQPCLERVKQVLLSYSSQFESSQLYHSELARPKPFYDSNELHSLLQSVNYQKTVLELNEFFENKDQKIIISDFQAPLVEQLKFSATDSSRILLLPIARGTNSNLLIDTVYLANRFSLGDQRKLLILSITNSGNRAFSNALIRLFNGNQQVSSLAIDIEPDHSTLVELEFEMTDYPAFEIRIEDNTFQLDNRFYLTIPTINMLNVCVIGNKRNRNIDALFQNGDYFNFSLFNDRTVDFDKILNADLVLFHSFDKLPEWADLNRIKGDVVVIPTATIDLINYSNFLNNNLRASGDSILRELKSQSLKHPFFDGIFDKVEAKTSMPEVRVLYQLTGVQEELLGMNLPFLQRLDQNGKSIYFFGGPLEERYSNLQNHALFLPIMYRIAEQSIGADRPLFMRLTDRPMTLPIQLGSSLVQLRGIGAEYVPEIYSNQSSVSLTLPRDLNEPGHYYLVSGADTLDILALNIPKEESLINWHDADMLREVFANRPNVTVLDTQSLDQLQASLANLKDGKPIWKYALLLALMFLVAEIAIHRWLK